MEDLVINNEKTKEIKYKSYRKKMEKEYKAYYNLIISKYTILAYILFYSICVLQIFSMYNNKIYTEISYANYAYMLIGVSVYYLLIDKFEIYQYENINIFAPNLLWIFLLFTVITSAHNDINVVSPWVLGMGICFLLSTLKGNGIIYPFYPLLRVPISFNSGKIACILLVAFFTFFTRIFIYLLYYFHFI